MKNLHSSMVVLLLTSFLFIACTKDDPANNLDPNNSNSTENSSSNESSGANTGSTDNTSSSTSDTDMTYTSADGTISVSIPLEGELPNGSTISTDNISGYPIAAYNPENVKLEDLKNKNIEFWGNYDISKATDGSFEYVVKPEAFFILRIYDGKYYEYIRVSNFQNEELIAIIRGKITNWTEAPNEYTYSFEFDNLQKGNSSNVDVSIAPKPDNNNSGGEHKWEVRNLFFFILNGGAEYQLFQGLGTPLVQPIE